MHRMIAAAAAAVLYAGAAQAAVVADFELNGSTANAIGGSPVTLINNGGTLGAQGITFGLNQGPSVSGLGSLTAYTIDVGFTLDQLNGPRNNNYVKLIDFSGLSSDSGYYEYNGGYLSVYPLGTSSDRVFAVGTPVRLTLSRDNAGVITGYVNGNQIFSRSDPNNSTQTIITALNPLRFFTDDTATGSGEASPGFVDYVRIADTALTPGQIAPPTSALPEPASWALMIAGFGGIGMRLRGRSPVREPRTAAR